MNRNNPPVRADHGAGFTLPAVLVVVAALLILVVGLLAMLGIERRTARSYVDVQRAEMAARAGLEEVRGIFKQDGANDDFIIIEKTLKDSAGKDAPIVQGKNVAPHLFLVRGEAGGGGFPSYRYVPLFSVTTPPTKVRESVLRGPELTDLVSSKDEDHLDYVTLPYQDKVRTAWTTMKDSKDRVIGRYTYWVEDLQSRVDAKSSGNADGQGGSQALNAQTFPAPGLNQNPMSKTEHPLNQIVLNAIDPGSTATKPGDLGKTLVDNRGIMLSPDSVLAAAEVKPPLKRDEITGRLTEEKDRAIEENLSAAIQPYDEQAVVPYAVGINPEVSGKPKLNLNLMLAKKPDEAVGIMSDFIDKALPTFARDRKGGFPDNYTKTLAACAIDYADENKEATIKMTEIANGEPGVTTNDYRGLDAYPLVSEYLIRPRWETVVTENGKKVVYMSVTVYAELWNMTNQTVTSSDVQISLESKWHFLLGANPNGVGFENFNLATPVLEEHDGLHWLKMAKVNGAAATSVTMLPNEYRLLTFGPTTFRFEGTAAFVLSPITLTGDALAAGHRGYHLYWNKQVVDKARGYIHRNDASLTYPETASLASAVRASIPGQSYTGSSAADHLDNMGDPRMSFYLGNPQDANAYPGNYSPSRRNIRYDSIYKVNPHTIYGRVLPSEWPDQGHNSIYGNFTWQSATPKTLPDDPDTNVLKFFQGLPTSKPEEAPMRLSPVVIDLRKSARYYSATELGRIYDPIQWNAGIPLESGKNQPWNDVKVDTKADVRYGGGNTLRIGRPEHPRFNTPQLHAARLLDLFHAGLSRSENAGEREGNVVRIDGHVNVNTASREALRAIAAGALKADKALAIRTSDTPLAPPQMRPPVQLKELTAPQLDEQADRVADAIIRSRPYATPAEIAGALVEDGSTTHRAMFASGAASTDTKVRDGTLNVFGNRAMYPDNKMIEWSDQAAEEVFARVYEASTVRSRNYRIWVVGQSLAPTTADNKKPEVLAEVRKAFTVFADPGERTSDGSIDKKKFKLSVIHENTF